MHVGGGNSFANASYIKCGAHSGDLSGLIQRTLFHNLQTSTSSHVLDLRLSYLYMTLQPNPPEEPHGHSVSSL